MTDADDVWDEDVATAKRELEVWIQPFLLNGPHPWITAEALRLLADEYDEWGDEMAEELEIDEAFDGIVSNLGDDDA